MMYTGTLIRDLHLTVDMVMARYNNYTECTWQDEDGYSCGSAAVILLLPSGDEARCPRHLGKPRQI